ncbi:MAG: hypothetical protein H7245_14650, partial [Candidatus Saccharibacteria bacterium]|nr:hypothetical protein [Pseudorhodobacter sp.]
IIFPAGEVATSQRALTGLAVDFAWHPFIARLAQRAGVQTLAMYVGGQNSRLFQVASHLSYPLRVALIFHETRRALRREVSVRIAEPLCLTAADKVDVVAKLRALTYDMAPAQGPKAADVFEFPPRIIL